jgi:hypothetical protein
VAFGADRLGGVVNEIAEASRQRKVIAMVAAIDARFHRQNPKLDAFDQAGRIWLAAADWSDDVWLKLAQAAGYKSKKTPGPDTRRLVREIYEGRSKAPLAKRAAS